MTKKWFPRTLALWQEPQKLKRHRAEEALRAWTLRSRISWVLLTLLVLLPPIVLRQELTAGSWPRLPEVLKAGSAVLGLGILLVTAVPWMMRLLPHHVRVTESGIGLISAGTRVLPFDSIRRGTFATALIDGTPFPTLNLELKNGRVEIGLASSPSVAELRTLLSGQGVALDP